MTGYRGKARRRSNRASALYVGFAIVACLLFGYFAAITGNLLPPFVDDFRPSPVGTVLWILASVFLIRANGNIDGERFAPQTLRWLAVAFFVLGIVVMVVPVFV